MMDEKNSPTDQLSSEAIAVLESIGCQATTVNGCLQGPHMEKLRAHIMSAIERVNEKVVSPDQRITRFEFLKRDLGQDTRELSPTFKLRRHFIVLRVCSLSHV